MALLAAVVVGAVAATTLLIVNRHNVVPRSHVDLDQMLGQPAFIVAKIVAALLLGVAGWLLASRRPDVPLGYLALTGALADALGVVGGEWAVYGRIGEHPVPLVGVGLWLGGWLFAIEPLVLVLVGFYLYFPRGYLPRSPALWFAASAVLLCLFGAIGSVFAPLQTDQRGPFARVSSPLGAVTFGGLDAMLGIGLVLGSAVVAVRWARSQGEERREFRALAVVALIGFALPLLPVSTESARILYQLHTLLLVLVVLASVLRHRLYGIDVALNRTLVFLILSALVAAVYGVLVGGIVLLAGSATLAATPFAAVAAALCLLPARTGVQHLVNRFLYGQRDEPFAVITRIATHLETAADPGTLLEGLLHAVVDALRLPGATLALATPDGVTTSITTATTGDETDEFPLTYRTTELGRLIVTRRPGQRTLTADETALLTQVARQSALAAQSLILLDQLTRSRARVVAAGEDERRRLRRDLHDGIGPLLTAAAARVDACRNLLDRDVPQVQILLNSVRSDLTEGLADLRRLVYTLRPPVLDELGLTEALRQICGRSTVPTVLEIPDALPELPAAVEITVYRIVAEAVTNVVRHARASQCTVQLALTDRVILDINDDGPPNSAWQTGVGLTSMRERTAELGGHWAAGPTGRGGNVHAELPLALFGVST